MPAKSKRAGINNVRNKVAPVRFLISERSNHLQKSWRRARPNNRKKKMKSYYNTKALLAGAALAGIMSGGAVSTVSAANVGQSGKPNINTSPGTLADEKKGETHDCKGKNSCKGKGGCKTGDNGCAGKNSCKGKGGCAVKDGKPVEKDNDEKH